ncbi:MAG: alcohol dehydrogenase [Rubritepida sp.]|nr:alcohol dehydrogenase [Rubritepida sp.]
MSEKPSSILFAPGKRRGALRRVLLGGALMLGICQADAAPDNFTSIERGRVLTTAGDCTGCHTTVNGQSMAGGLALETPFGRIVTPNITPDDETGIGRWSEAEFTRAMQFGIRRDGAHLYPAFPYPNYTRVTRQDISDIYAYLRTVPPATNVVDRDTLPFPFNIRAAMAGWNLLFFTPGEFRPEAGRSEVYNRGAYLVEGLGHCGTCHTPRNLLGADSTRQTFEGGNLLSWFAPNITGDTRRGIGGWSVQEIVEYLKTGRNARSAASGPMAEVVMDSTSRMNEADLTAIATYLKERGAPNGTAAPAPAPAPLAASDASMRAGMAIYTDTCMACHTGGGGGIDLIFPRLAGSALVQQDDPTTLLRIVISGAQSAATDLAPTGPAMPALGWRLSDRQVADVLTFIRNSWGNAAPAVTEDQSRRMRATVAPQ